MGGDRHEAWRRRTNLPQTESRLLVAGIRVSDERHSNLRPIAELSSTDCVPGLSWKSLVGKEKLRPYGALGRSPIYIAGDHNTSPYTSPSSPLAYGDLDGTSCGHTHVREKRTIRVLSQSFDQVEFAQSVETGIGIGLAVGSECRIDQIHSRRVGWPDFSEQLALASG